jgi:alpha-beta hydrolase superfamily lysophospholipase
MQTLQLRIDVASVVSLQGPLEVALTAYLPDPARLSSPPIVMAAFPGGGYSRGYFDMHFAGHAHYSEAEHHTAAGLIFIAGDHLGVGDSSIPDFSKLSIEMIAAANDHAIREAIRRLESGTLAPGFPAVKGATKIGIGQSMGGCIAIVMQGNHRTYDGIAPLGYSAIHTVLPQRSQAAYLKAMQAHSQARSADLSKLSILESSQQIEDFVYPFHWEDVPQDILDADMSGGYPLRKTAPPFGSCTLPTCALQMMAPGCVAKEAAAIDVPVLVGVGARDVCPDPHAEIGAYKRSDDVSLYVVPRMAHMHNFASTRRELWDRLVGWSRMIAQSTGEIRHAARG